MKNALLRSVLLLSLVPTLAAGEDPWPCWRGAQRDGVSRETGWTVEGAAEPLWKRNVGLGYSCVSIAGGRLFTLGWDEKSGNDVVVALDPLTGAELWRHAYPAKKWALMHGGGTLTTPTVDGDVVFVSNREGRLMALDVATGKVRWERNVAEEHGIEPPKWGLASSPVVHGDRILLNAGRALALSKKDGSLVWKSRDFGSAYASVARFELGDEPCLAVFASQGIGVVDAAKGEERFFHPWKNRYDVNAATPVVVGERLFVSSGDGAGCALLEMGAEGIAPVWENKDMSTKMSGCVLWDEHLYGFDGAILKCLDAQGEEQWAQRGLGLGALMIADGKLLVQTDEGELVVAKASPAGYEELSRRDVLDDGVYWTSPVLANGVIYCRSSLGDLVALDHRPKERDL